MTLISASDNAYTSHINDKQRIKKMSQQALLIIDLQNDYFPEGKFVQHNTELVLLNNKIAIKKAKQKNIPIILIQHISDTTQGVAPFFNPDTQGVQIHTDILKLVPNAEIVKKGYADSFEKTNLEKILQKHKVTELMITGMMTRNCITHTAISKAADKYDVTVVMDCCSSIDEMIHNIALNALSIRIALQTVAQIFI